MLNNINISPLKQNLIVYIFLTVVTLAVFWQVKQFEFINLDDHVYVTGNSHIQSGITLTEIGWAFSTNTAEFWHPLTWLSLMLDYQFYDLNAGGYHLTNLILHIMSTLLLFWLFNRMTGAIWKSAFIAAFFALHPLRVESAAWIAERKDVLSAFFWMLTLCLYVYYAEKPVIKRYLLVLFCFACGLMSKPMVVTLPVVMILLDYWPLGRFQFRKNNLLMWQLKEKIPFFILSAIFSTITLYAQYKTPVKVIPFDYRIVNALVSFVTYLEKILWPHDLVVFYPFSQQLSIWQLFGFTLLIIAVSVAVIAKLKRVPYLFVGWLWYAVTILPVLGIIQIGSHWTLDLYTYLPSVGIAIMLAWGIPSLFRSENIRKKILFPAAITVIALLAVLTWQQCGYWKNSIELWNRNLRVIRDDYRVHSLLASAYVKIGQYQHAMENFNKVISLNPDNYNAYNGRGIIYSLNGRYQLAIENYNEAIRLKPIFAPAYYNRGNIYSNLGQYQLAIEDFNNAIRLSPNSPMGDGDTGPDYCKVYNERGIIYGKLNQHQRAIEDFSKAIDLNHNYFKGYNNRGFAYAHLGQYQRAIADYKEAIRLKPDYAAAYYNRGNAYFSQVNKSLGCRDAKKACQLGACTLLEIAKNKGYCH